MTDRDREATDPPAGGSPVRRPLGQLALEAGLITKEQLASAIADIQSSGQRLREVMIRRGLMDELQLAQLLELQERGGPVPRLGSVDPLEGAEPEPAPRATDAVRPLAPRLRLLPGGQLP